MGKAKKQKDNWINNHNNRKLKITIREQNLNNIKDQEDRESFKRNSNDKLTYTYEKNDGLCVKIIKK